MKNEIMLIKYGIQCKYHEKDLKDEDESIDLNIEFESEEERLLIEQDRIDIKKSEEEWLNFWKHFLAKESQKQYSYIVNNTAIKHVRTHNNRPKEFIQIFPESGIMQHFYTDKKTDEAKLSEFHLYHNTDQSDWKLSYEIEEIKSENKIILGYECYKMIIRETKINEKENWEIKNRYELYVTDKINLPASLVIHLWKPITDLCALEIKEINMERPNSYIMQYVIEIKTDIDETELKLPKIYSDILTEEE